MGKENKSYRIRTNVGQDSVVNFSIDNTTETLEILSLKITQENTYRLMGSDTGIVAGRVLANGGFGVPNVKVSVFIEYEDTDNIEQRILYTYSSTTDRNYDGVRYNLLPDKVDDECHQNIGTFPSKRVLLDNNNWIDVFDKYYKFTTRTNEAGDYMIYGVPTGNQTIHMDVDMSDIGVLSQKPRDMIHNGYNGNMFESPTKFKTDTNIDSLAQVRTQDQAVYVYPFWGDTTDSNLNASITRCDMNINYKFEPTCIFMGSVITDTGENAMTKKCIGAKKQGKMSEMITGEGKIEMIRKTPNGQIEQFSVNGDNNINGDGVWCYQIPMNLDYVMHDEFGKMVMTDNPNIGIPTRARVRFRLSMAESPSDAIARKRARFLIPNNPRLVESDYPDYCETKEIDYEFGTKTKNENFRDLFWNNVYTVKSYIPRLQKSRLPNNLRHLGIKTVNHSGGHNPIPFNNLRIKFNFVYMFLCTLVKVLVKFSSVINSVLTFISYILLNIGQFFFHASDSINISILGAHPLNGVAKLLAKYNGHGIKDSDDINADEYVVKVWEDMQNDSSVCGGIATWFIKIFLGIGCGIVLDGLCETDDGEVISVSPGTYDPTRDFLKKNGIMVCNDRIDLLYNCIENQLAQDNEVTQFNFYNDWINGVVYLPLWYRKIKKRRNGSVKKDVWCSTDNTINNVRAYKKNLRLYNTNIPKRTVSEGNEKTMGTINPLVNNEDTVSAYANNESGAEELTFKKKNDENCYGYQCHKFSRTYFKIYKGLVYEKVTMLGDTVYYYKPCDYDPSTGNSDLVTLFATDLVLLGSLNDCDIHGIPQFFKALDSTTYNMPPDLLSEYYDYTNENNQNGNDEHDSEEIDLGSRITEYTGADWGNLGVDQSNYNKAVITVLGSTYSVDANENEYDNGGLFYGLTCFDSYTKPKSCINLSRICEFGVSLDETNELPSSTNNGTDNDTDTLTPDGFISYDEIYNPDYRSMFATLNGNFLKTTLNPETGLLEYDLNHMYIENFDGSLKQLMKAKTVNGTTEKSGFEEKANYVNNHNLEQSSDTYLSFRYGNYVKRNGKKIYFYENNNSVGHAGFATILGPTINGQNRQPRYENSFYFYFGLNEGKTAIDKFNNEFFSDCANKFAADAPYELIYEGNSWCPINARDGFIAFNMNIEQPYSVKFTNKDTNEVYYQDNISKEKFIFVDPQYLPDEYAKYAVYTLENGSENVYIMENGTYSIEVTDAYDNVYDDDITFELPKIGFACDVNPFNCKNSELMERFKDEDELLSTTYADIADYAKFINNGVIDMNVLTYSLFSPDYVIRENDVYYTKTPGGVFRPSIATSDIIVKSTDEYYYYHEPKLDRSVRGFVALSEITEDDFVIDFKPIEEDFFGSNYIGTSVTVHVTYTPYADESTIPYGETYYVFDNGKYEPMVAQEDIIVPVGNDGDDGTHFYNRPNVNVTEKHSQAVYAKYNVGAVISVGETYYERTGSDPQSYEYVSKIATIDIIVQSGNEYYHKVDICGYLGYIILDGVITHYFGVPYGGQKYKIIVTQLCLIDNDLDPSTPEVWGYTRNTTIINVIVYEDEFKMYINGIDYDLIQKFRTGWNDSKLSSGEFLDAQNNFSVYEQSSVYGWDDILNIGRYSYNSELPLPLETVSYMSNDAHSTISEILAICNVLNVNYNGNATGDDNGETPYTWFDTYCYNAPSNDIDYYNKGVVNKRTYSYTISPDVTLYDSEGNQVTSSQIVHGTIYYLDVTHTTEAVLGLDYMESTTDEEIPVVRIDTKIDYMNYSDDEYLYDGGLYWYDYPFETRPADRAYTVNGYPSGIRVNMFRRTLRIKDGVTLYREEGGVYVQVTSRQLVPRITYYKYNGTTYVLADENVDYVLYSPIIKYKLEPPFYIADFKIDGTDEIVVSEDNNGILTYKTENNVEYADLECFTFYDYREFIDNINSAINNRLDAVRTVAGAFRINKGETMLTLTTKTKAKPVKYLIAGSSEIVSMAKLYNYRPAKILNRPADLLPQMKPVLTPIEFNKINDINNTKYVSIASSKNVSDGYVVDKNLDTPSVSFTLPTFTYDYIFVAFNTSETITNGDEYYSEEVIPYPADTELPAGTVCYHYTTGSTSNSKYYIKVTLDEAVSVVGGDYYYTTGEMVKNIAVIGSSLRPGSGDTKLVSEFIPYAHTTSTIWKKSTNSKQYLPYQSNKRKHPYYVSAMNDNDSVIPPGKDFNNFKDFGSNKNLDTTFGVHFYNKPLNVEFKTIFSFINNIPAYPKHSLGDDSVIGSLHGYSKMKYYSETLTDNDTMINEGTSVYALIDSNSEKNIERITLKSDYTKYVVGTQNYNAYDVGDIINKGDIYYIQIGRRLIPTYVKYTATEPITVNIPSTYFYRSEKLIDIKEKFAEESDYQQSNRILYGSYYYKKNSNNVFVRYKNNNENGSDIIVTETDTNYYLLEVPYTFFLYNFVKCTETSQYKVYNGDILYYESYTPYPAGSTIPPNTYYYYYNETAGTYDLSLSINAIENVNQPDPSASRPHNIYFMVDANPVRINRHIVNISDGNTMLINDYVADAAISTPNFYYPTSSSTSVSKGSYVNRNLPSLDGDTSVISSNLSLDVNKALSVNRAYKNYAGNILQGDCYYNVAVDCLNDYNLTDTDADNNYVGYKWIAVKNGDIVTYNNIGEYRYFNLTNTAYAVKLTKRPENTNGEILVTGLDPAYKVISDPETESTMYVKTPSNVFDTQFIAYNVGNIIPKYTTYYLRENSTFIKKRTAKLPLTVDARDKYYKPGYPINENEYNYRGLYTYSTLMDEYVYYGPVTKTKEITEHWTTVDVYMPGFMTGYAYNGIPRRTNDNSNIKAELNGTDVGLYTPNTPDNIDEYKNINVKRLIYTPNSHYDSTNYPPTYGVFYDIEPSIGTECQYQYAEVPLADSEFIYSDGYGDEYRNQVLGTLSVMYEYPVFTYFNLGRSYNYVNKNLEYEDNIITKTYYISNSGYTEHQTLYYVYDLDTVKDGYPLLYYNTNVEGSEFNSNLRYDVNNNRYYFKEMPSVFKDIENSGYISKSKSTHFNVNAYLRNKYHQGQDEWDASSQKMVATSSMPIEILRPNDKFFVIACVDGYYTISPVIETQRFLCVLNYTGFDIRKGSPIYILPRDSRDRNSEEAMKTGIHYIEDMYYMLYYRFVMHVASFDYTVNDNGEANGSYNSDVYTQVCSVPEGTAEHCYIKVVDEHDGTVRDDDGNIISYTTLTYWASAIKVNLSSIGGDAFNDSGQIHSWLNLLIEDASRGMRIASKQTVGDRPLTITEFESYEDMKEDYVNSQTT